MRFFVPRCQTAADAEHVWQATRDFLASGGVATEPRRLWKVAYKASGVPQVVKVGDAHPASGEEVLVILKAADGSRYFVCTAGQGVVQGSPVEVANVPGETLAVAFH